MTFLNGGKAMHAIKAKITSLRVQKNEDKKSNGIQVQITLAAVGDYSIVEIDPNTEKKINWNSFLEKSSEDTRNNNRKAVLYPTTERISVDPSFHSIVQEIYFQQTAVVFEVNITSSSQDNSISIYKIILGDK